MLIFQYSIPCYNKKFASPHIQQNNHKTCLKQCKKQNMRALIQLLYFYNAMDNLNKSIQKVQRACTTPERMRLVQSIKKSIHRSIEKINPAEYKNLLKGQFIFMHLCHKGQIINSQYTKVALFMGAIVMKKASEKITAVVTNDTSNKIVKKLASMNKPILSVLWLEACFQQKRKVPYQDFLYQDDKKTQAIQPQKQQQINTNFDALINNYKTNLSQITKQFVKNHNLKFLRFVDKKQKTQKIRNNIIPVHQIDIGVYLPQRRKSQTITDRVHKKKNQKKKVQFKDKQIKSQVIELQSKESIKVQKKGIETKQKYKQKQKQKQKFQFKSQTKQIQLQKDIKQINSHKNQTQNQHQHQNQNQTNQKKQSKRLNKHLYEKYLKDFKNYENNIKKQEQQQIIQQPQFNIAQDLTPCFMNFNQQNQQLPQQYDDYLDFRQCYDDDNVLTPRKISEIQTDQHLLQTYSIKKQRNRNIKINVVNPMNSQKIQKINHVRQIQNLPLLQISGNDSKNIACVINRQSKIQAILAMLSKPRLIVAQSFINHLQKQPTSDITQQLYKKYQIKCKLNITQIQGKKIVLLDSVMGVASLSNIIKQCDGTVISIPQFFFQKQVDFVITNKKMYLKTEKKQYRVLNQTDFIDMLISIQK